MVVSPPFYCTQLRPSTEAARGAYMDEAYTYYGEFTLVGFSPRIGLARWSELDPNPANV